MDGLDFTAIDQEIFNGSSFESSDGEGEMPLPDCIGIDSAVQDDEQERLKQTNDMEADKKKRTKTRSQIERELELKMLNPNSIRRQILEKSLKDGNNKIVTLDKEDGPKGINQPPSGKTHVMDIVEKAGMRGIDKEKINEIIHEASKGSLFYKKQAQRQEEIHKSIENMLTKVKIATPTQVSNAKIVCDKILEELEKKRVFNRIIVHFDLDMFFAAVEIRDNPELADKPVAVGGDSMVSTSNYIARRYGVRAAMPGFIAKKLCPELLLIKPNGVKYRQASAEVFDILEQYDPELTGMSLDEAYLDLTECVKIRLERDGLEIDEYYDGTLPKTWWKQASEIVEEIRQAIYDRTKLTCSAGISCNTLLAKISTDINKPNGQYMVEGYPREVTDFIAKTPVGKVSGIGKVSGQFLNALDIKTCGDIYEKRHYLPLVFYEINVRFYLRVALGDGSTCIKSDEQRKSKSVERTFTAIKDTLILLDKLDSICEELCTKYLKPYRIRGRTITIKLKRNTFTTTTKSYSMLVPTNDKPVIYSAAKNLLLSEISHEPPEISYRLLGVKLSNLADESVTTNQLTIDAMLRNQEMSKKATKSDISVHRIEDSNSSSHSSANNELALRSELITQEQSVLDCDDPGKNMPVIAQDESSNGSVKRKEPATKRIDDFFSTSSHKQLKVPHKSKVSTKDYCSESNEDIRFYSQEDEEESAVVEIGEPNEMSQREQRQNEPNVEDFQCPYCFKPFSDFSQLESHVDRCYLKTSIDVYKPFCTQRTVRETPSPTMKKSGAGQSGMKGSSSTQRALVKKQASTRKRQMKISSGLKLVKATSSPSTQMGNLLPKFEDSPKVSFYQKFIDSNSQSINQSARLEPLQCPYCMHGFLNFASLENHVMICTKNTSK